MTHLEASALGVAAALAAAAAMLLAQVARPVGADDASAKTGPLLRQSALFVSGEDGYHTYRIPSLMVTARGTLLAFCEGRRHGPGDSGDIDLLLKRSTDGGRTWSQQQVVWDDGPNTCGNPCPVLDRDTATIWLLMTWNNGADLEPAIIAGTAADTRRVFVTSSRDDGLTWAPPREITSQVKRPDWTWYATGPGAGIQTERGAHRGRLVIPCDHYDVATRRGHSHIIYSDDHGATWRLGGTAPQDQVDECEVVELTDARLLLNMRNFDRALHRCRQVAYSSDGGLTWTDQRSAPALIEPNCQASIRRYSWPEQGENIILFSNPAHESSRVNLTVRLSRDDGATWPIAQTLHAGPSGYSCLAVLPGGEVACLYEAGQNNFRETIVFAAFNLEWLTHGDTPEK